MKDDLTQAPAVLLRLGQVLRRVPVSRATWWRWCRIGYAPAPVRIGENVTCWRGSDIDAFIEVTVAARKDETA